MRTRNVRTAVMLATLCVTASAVLLRGGATLLAQPGGQPPAEKTTDRLWEEIWTLEVLNQVDLTKKQLSQLVPALEAFRKQREALTKKQSSSALRKALWAIRTAMLEGRDAEPLWERMEAVTEPAEQAEAALDRLTEQSRQRVTKLLTAEQRRALAMFDTPEARMTEVIEELVDVVSEAGVEQEEWTDWRDATADELAEVAADIEGEEEPVGGVAARAAALFDETRAKGPGYARESAKVLAGKLIEVVISKERRTSEDEQQERVADFIREMLHEDVMFGLLKEKLALANAKAE